MRRSLQRPRYFASARLAAVSAQWTEEYPSMCWRGCSGEIRLARTVQHDLLARPRSCRARHWQREVSWRHAVDPERAIRTVSVDQQRSIARLHLDREEHDAGKAVGLEPCPGKRRLVDEWKRGRGDYDKLASTDPGDAPLHTRREAPLHGATSRTLGWLNWSDAFEEVRGVVLSPGAVSGDYRLFWSILRNVPTGGEDRVRAVRLLLQVERQFITRRRRRRRWRRRRWCGRLAGPIPFSSYVGLCRWCDYNPSVSGERISMQTQRRQAASAVVFDKCV